MSRAFAYADGREAEQAPPLAPEDRDVATTSSPRGGARKRLPDDSADACRSDIPEPTPRQAPPAVTAPPLAAVPAAVTAGEPASMDPQLHEIYSKETSSHLAEIRNYLRKRTGLPAPHELPESVYRAIHTLSGSSKMAEARHGIRITEPLNHYMRKVFDSGRGMSDAALAVSRGCGARHRERRVAHQRDRLRSSPSNRRSSSACAVLEAELDAELARAAIETSASAIVPQLAEPLEAPRRRHRPPRRRRCRAADALRSSAAPTAPAAARRRNSITRSPTSTARRRPS